MIRNSTSLATTYFSRPLYNLTSFRLTRNVSSNLDIEKLEKESTDAQIEGVSDEVIKRELEIERKRNKSRLRTADHMILHEKSPFIEPNYWYQGTLRYKRRLYGRYGAESGVDPAICWPVKQELEDAKEYERVAHPFTIPQMMEMAKEARLAKEKEWRVRQEQVLAKMEKLEDWKADFLARTKAKEQQAREARERRTRLVEEVRRHFGFQVDPKDEKFQEMLAKKEKEERKVAKEARRVAREAKTIEKLLKKNVESNIEKESEKPVDNDTK